MGNVSFELKKEHVDYIDSIRESLIAAEDYVKKIKGSKEFRAAKNYFGVMAHQGILFQPPKYSNGYQIEMMGNYVNLDKIEDLLTDEQKLAIQMRMN